MPKVTIGDYLLIRLSELGVSHMFGVPGDYNLGFLDQITNYPKIEWIGTCNELNGAYATDGYARIKGAGALLTTFGVGELSAINGIAGAYAEYVPIVNIVGIPSAPVREKKSIVHHTLGDGRFSVFSDMYKAITVAQTILNSSNAASEIDRVLTECWLRKRPVYVALPSDVSYLEIDAPKKPLDLSYPKSNKDAVNELVERAALAVEKSKNPVVLIDVCAQKHPMKVLILEFIEKTGIPFATMNMGKAIINESHAQFIGNYNGDFSSDGVQKLIEESDCVITFGTLMSDFNTGSFTAKININATIEIHSFHARVKQSVYDNVLFCETISTLTHRLSSYHFDTKVSINKKISEEDPREISICHKRFWNQISHFLKKNSIVLAEAGTSMFGTQQMHMPDDSTYIAQTLWGSIGYTVGALLGVCIAAPKRQAVLFVGDGSFQLTAQEISTVLRNRLTPTIFLLDNDGYTVERVIHGPTMPYNDIQHWNYTQLPKMFGKDVWSAQVNTEIELKDALIEREKNKDKMAFITVMMEKMDAPDVLIKIGKAVAELNKYTEKKI